MNLPKSGKIEFDWRLFPSQLATREGGGSSNRGVTARLIFRINRQNPIGDET